MKISAQEEYGLRCLLRLARRAQNRLYAPLSITDIAVAEGLSTPYVAKLLAVLRQAGLVEAFRGPAGGYRLALAAEDIRLGSLLLAVGEPLFEDPGYCNRYAGTETNGCCVHLETCSLRALWQTLEQWLRKALDQLTLADLLRGEGEIIDLLRLRLSEMARSRLPTLVSLPVLGEDRMAAAAAGPGGTTRKKTAKSQ